MTGFKIYKALINPILFAGVPLVQLIIEILVSLYLGLFVNVYFLILVVVLHASTSLIYAKSPFALRILFFSILKTPLSSDFVKGANDEI